MPGMTSRERFLAALHGDPVDRPPVWLMRQAGRYLPEYRAIRSSHGFWDVCQTPELSTRVALEPLQRFGLDAAIVFSDILVIPHALGLGVSFGKGEGPRFERPLRTRADLAAWQREGLAERLRYVPDAVRHLRRALNDQYGLVGFAGAPFTLYAYCVEGGSSDDFRTARTLLYANPDLARAALHALAEAVADLALAQVEAGADAIQLFDTWGGLLAIDEYREFAVPPLRHAIERIKASGKPVLLFARGGHHLLTALGETGASGFSLDWRTPWSTARAAYPRHILQGNIDPILLLNSPDVVRQRTRELLASMQWTSLSRSCIVNLGHGILPETPPENVAALAQTVAEFRKQS
jgi:uroporphyrinogen decarboxylase